MKKDGIQTRKRKPKSHASVAGNLPGPSAIHKTEIKSNLLGESSVSKILFSLFSLTHPPVSTRILILQIFNDTNILSMEVASAFRTSIACRPQFFPTLIQTSFFVCVTHFDYYSRRSRHPR